MAIGLASRGWKVTVQGGTSASHGARIEMLAADCVRQLARLGVDRDTLAAVAHPCPGIWSQWGAGTPDQVDQLCGLWGTAWSLRKGQLDALLRDRAHRLGVTCAAERAPVPDGVWQVLATGATHRRASDADDELIAITVCGELQAESTLTDGRLMIEALPDGWAYGLLGPGRSAGVALITDAVWLTGGQWQSVALDALMNSERVAILLKNLRPPLRVTALPVPCQRRPVRAGHRVVRIGDALATHDPIAGRGLWHALWSANHVGACLDQAPAGLDAVENTLQLGYDHYLLQRHALYERALARYGSAFWARRTQGKISLKVDG